ncbi:MAG: dihydropteroate synthase [Dehalococcoidales bacterium]|nr:MAG: dihydropteroate synthase [Dehalococcoidales bacterium]
MLVIGERINASNSSVAEAIVRRDEQFMTKLAKAQANVGADFIDVNVGTGKQSKQEQMADMEWAIEAVQAATDKPLAIDSDIPDVIEAGMRKYGRDELIINSVNAEPEKLEAIGRFASERQVRLVALAMSAEGIPRTAEERLAACEVIMTHLARFGVNEEQVYFDPLVLPVSIDSAQGLTTLKTLERIKSQYPKAKTVMGLSNISYGLPNRKLINRAFLLMAAYAGLDAAILDPLDARTMSLIKAADILVEKDPQCRRYIRAYRNGTLIA